MAKQGGLGDRFFIGGFDISGDVCALTRISTPVAQLEVPDITLSAMARLDGIVGGELEFKVWFNDATEREHEALKSLPTTDVIVTYCRGTTAGNPAFWFKAKQINYDWVRGADGSLEGTVLCVLADGEIPEWGEQVTAGKVTHASAASSTSVNDAAASANGVGAVLHVFDIDSGTPTFVLQQSSDNGAGDAWATLVSFTAVASGAEPTAERKEASGSPEQYLRATTTGTFTNADFFMAKRRGTAEDRVAYA